MVFTTRLAGGKGGRNGLEHELRRLGIRQKNGKPNHPQTQGKVERFQQTMKNWLRAQPHQPATLAELQSLLGHLRRHLQHPAPAPLPPGPRHPRHRLRRPAQGQPRRPRRRHPRPRPHRPHRQHRARHPPPQRPPPPHRHRPAPRRNPRPAPRPGPAHPRHQRRHRRTPPRAHPQPRQATTSPPAAHQAGQRKTPRTLTWVRGVLDVLRHHMGSRDRTRTYNLPVKQKACPSRERTPFEAFQPAAPA